MSEESEKIGDERLVRETEHGEVVVILSEAQGDRSVWLAWPSRDWRSRGGCRSKARAQHEVVDNAGGCAAGADSRAERASGRDAARACGPTWKSPATMKGVARARASALTAARMTRLSYERRPPVAM